MKTTRRNFLSLLGFGSVAAVAAPELLKAKPLATGGLIDHKLAAQFATGERGPEMILPRAYAESLQIPADRLFDSRGSSPEAMAKIAERLAKLEKDFPRIVKERGS